MSVRSASILASGVILLASFSLTTASAADPPAIAEGRERFQRGVELFRDGDYRAALIEFNRANDVAPSYKIQFNIGQTCLELQDYACALRAYSRYLSEGGKEVPKDRRQLAEREVERTKRLVGTVRIVSNRQGADVTIDDVASGRTPLADPVMISAGRHKVTLSLAPLSPATRVIDVAGGDDVTITIDLNDPPPAPPVPVNTPPVANDPVTQRHSQHTEPPAEQPVPSRAPFWIGVVTTTALAAGTTVTGLLALSAKSKLDDNAGRLGATTKEVDSDRTKLRTFSTVTDILLGTTVLAAGITIVLYFATSPSKRGMTTTPHTPQTASGVRLSPTGVLLF